jgi:hypothetical protein
MCDDCALPPKVQHARRSLLLLLSLPLRSMNALLGTLNKKRNISCEQLERRRHSYTCRALFLDTAFARGISALATAFSIPFLITLVARPWFASTRLESMRQLQRSSQSASSLMLEARSRTESGVACERLLPPASSSLTARFSSLTARFLFPYRPLPPFFVDSNPLVE